MRELIQVGKCFLNSSHRALPFLSLEYLKWPFGMLPVDSLHAYRLTCLHDYSLQFYMMELSEGGTTAAPKAPYGSTKRGPCQFILALTWTTPVADAVSFRSFAQLRSPVFHTSATNLDADMDHAGR